MLAVGVLQYYQSSIVFLFYSKPSTIGWVIGPPKYQVLVLNYKPVFEV